MTKIMVVQVIWTDLYGLYYDQAIRNTMGLKKATEWAIRMIFPRFCSKTR